MFKHIKKKFNPENRVDKVIKSEGTKVHYQEFYHALRSLKDKKAHGLDGMPISYLRKLGTQEAFRFFCKWTSKQLSEKDNLIFSTARLTFLSKNKKETVQAHNQYRCLAIQSSFVRILEYIVIKKIRR